MSTAVQKKVSGISDWFASSRFNGIIGLYSPRQVAIADSVESRRIAELLNPDRAAVRKLIAKESA